MKIIKTLLSTCKNDEDKLPQNTEAVLDPSQFTTFMGTKEGNCHAAEIERFEPTWTFEIFIAKTIARTKPNKASGVDELFSEAFKIAPEQF